MAKPESTAPTKPASAPTDKKADDVKKAAPPAPTPREAAVRDLKHAIELLQRAVDEENFRLVARAVHKTNSIRRSITATTLRPILEVVAPALIAKLDDIAARATPGAAEEAEAKEIAEKEAADKAKADKAAATAAAAAGTAMTDDIAAAPVLSGIAGAPVLDAPSLMSDDSTTAAAAAAVASPSAASAPATPTVPATGPALTRKPGHWVPEVAVYAEYLLAWFALDRSLPVDARGLIDGLVAQAVALNRRSMDWLTAPLYSLQALVHERLGQLAQLRPSLILATSAAARAHNSPTHAVLIVAVLRSLVNDRLYDKADKFRAHVTFPDETDCDPNTVARFLYYSGFFDMVMLQYTAAHAQLAQALRKAPTDGAWGFSQVVNKAIILVELLLGEMPDRKVFAVPQLRGALAPYFRLARAVRQGNVAGFDLLLQDEAFGAALDRDGVRALVMRLRQNVIKTGLRKLTTSYSRMTFENIAERLSLPSAADAELVTAKAIHDGVISAVIDAEAGTVTAKNKEDVYRTGQPKAAFAARIAYCFDVYEEAMRALRFPSAGTDDKEGGAAKKKEALEAVAQAQKNRLKKDDKAGDKGKKK